MKKTKQSIIEQLVLIALPQPAVRSRLAAALKKRGIQSIEAANGYMAVQLAGAKLPDCIVISENIGIYSLAKIRKLLGTAPARVMNLSKSVLVFTTARPYSAPSAKTGASRSR